MAPWYQHHSATILLLEGMALMGSNEQWLYRQGDLILGPVPTSAIIEKIAAHELDGRAEVQAMGSGVFRRLSDLDGFRVHLAKADVKKKVDLDAGATARARASRRNLLLAITGGALLVLAGAVVVVGNYLAVHTPGKSSDDLYADLISADAPTVTRARAATADDELVDYNPTGGKRPAAPPRDPATPRPVRDPGTPRSKPGEEDPDGMAMGQVDQAGINDVVKKYQKTLYPCLVKVARPGVLAKVPIEFSVASGKVTKLWIENPDYKTGELPDCLLKELEKWPFKEAQNASVQLSFNIGKKG